MQVTDEDKCQVCGEIGQAKDIGSKVLCKSEVESLERTEAKVGVGGWVGGLFQRSDPHKLKAQLQSLTWPQALTQGALGWITGIDFLQVKSGRWG